jgi:hypothetical protein
MDPELIAVLLTVAGAALFGAIGYTVRSVHGWRNGIAERHAQMVGRLQSLAALLRTSGSIFEAQAEQRNRLHSLVREKPEVKAVAEQGYEAIFASAYGTFTDAEKELHGLIRSMTVNAVRPVNSALSSWLDEDSYFKTVTAPLKDAEKLSRWLHQLELHLTLWHAKYDYWMEDPRHSLVYLGDEADHGVPFPRGIEKVVDEALRELGQPNFDTLPVPRG